MYKKDLVNGMKLTARNGKEVIVGDDLYNEMYGDGELLSNTLENLGSAGARLDIVEVTWKRNSMYDLFCNLIDEGVDLDYLNEMAKLPEEDNPIMILSEYLKKQEAL